MVEGKNLKEIQRISYEEQIMKDIEMKKLAAYKRDQWRNIATSLKN